MALAVAAGLQPELLILDEPTGGLGGREGEDVIKALVNAKLQSGATVLFSSHSLTDMFRMADQVAVLEGGRLAFSGLVDGFQSAVRR